MYSSPRYLLAGDEALVVELGDVVSPEVNGRVRSLTHSLEREAIPGVRELVPTYRSVLIYYEPLKVSLPELEKKVRAIYRRIGTAAPRTRRVVHVPTLYGGEHGPDLERVSQHAGLSVQDVVRIHSGTDYLVYMMGFSPGFAYLGGLAEELHTPRLDTPRTMIPAGSVGIAETQTGVYPMATPGGWQLIGRTPLRMFDPAREPPALVEPGDYIRFVPIESDEAYDAIAGSVEAGSHELIVEEAS